MKIGYVIISDQVIKEGCKIGYLYREKPEDEGDSGWRIFSGKESQEYADDPTNFAMYNVSTLLDIDPELRSILADDYPVMYERDTGTNKLILVEDD